MKRAITALAVSVGLMLTAGVGVASASDLLPQAAPATPAQQNDSDQGQVQIVPIAPQANVQNVNVATFDDVEQGDANNANTGQAVQQENTSESQGQSPHHSSTASGGQSRAGQENDNDQHQVQVVPIAPQANVQNVNVATFDDVEQGDANNANTGQAVQEENKSASSHGSNGKSGGASHAGAQENDNDQRQLQIVPIAPQLNVQNVNIATFDDVEQGDANNANTGQAVQQENTRKGGSPSGKSGYGRSHGSKCDRCAPKHSGGQRNDNDQRQVQIVPIAPQANVQNVNIATFGDVEQGDANNANTGQAAQQENSWKGGSPHGKHHPKPCGGKCEPKHEPKPCEAKYQPKHGSDGCAPKHEPKPCERKCAPKHEPKPCDRKHQPKPCDRKYEPKHEPKPCDRKHEPKHDSKPSYSKDCPAGDKRPGQRNENDQRQVQIVPVAPQLNVQNTNLFTFGDVEQGDANNANTGQAVQQRNSQLTGHGSIGGKRPNDS